MPTLTFTGTKYVSSDLRCAGPGEYEVASQTRANQLVETFPDQFAFATKEATSPVEAVEVVETAEEPAEVVEAPESKQTDEVESFIGRLSKTGKKGKK